MCLDYHPSRFSLAHIIYQYLRLFGRIYVFCVFEWNCHHSSDGVFSLCPSSSSVIIVAYTQQNDETLRWTTKLSAPHRNKINKIENYCFWMVCLCCVWMRVMHSKQVARRLLALDPFTIFALQLIWKCVQHNNKKSNWRQIWWRENSVKIASMIQQDRRSKGNKENQNISLLQWTSTITITIYRETVALLIMMVARELNTNRWIWWFGPWIISNDLYYISHCWAHEALVLCSLYLPPHVSSTA